MGSLLVVVAVSAIAFFWIRGARRNRDRWLTRLDLPGTWEREGAVGTLELSGNLSGGEYRFTDPEEEGGSESGVWALHGHTLRLTAAAGPARDYDLRMFREGKVGIDGPGRERRIYQKVPSNVVPLRARR